MIVVNDQFSFSRYSHGWELHESKKGKSRGGDKINVTDVTYYSTLNLPNLLKAIVMKSVGNTDNIKEIINVIKKAETDIVTAINLAGIEEVCSTKVSRRIGEDDEFDSIDEDDDDEEDYILDTEDAEEITEEMDITTPQKRKLM